MDEKGSGAMLTSIQSAGVAPEVNLRNLWCAGKEACNRGTHPGFETQGRHHQKSGTGLSVAPTKGTYAPPPPRKKRVLIPLCHGDKFYDSLYNRIKGIP